MTARESVEVRVVGAGPYGLVAGITLARYGVNVLVVEQRDGGSSLSRAPVIGTRGMELMRRFGLEGRVRAGAANVDLTALVTFTFASNGGVVMLLGYPSDDEAARVSPTGPAWVQSHHPSCRRRAEYAVKRGLNSCYTQKNEAPHSEEGLTKIDHPAKETKRDQDGQGNDDEEKVHRKFLNKETAVLDA